MITSLFSGIGGLELGLEAAGLGPVRWQVEQDPFCRRVLAHHWPEARQHDDVRTATGALLGTGGVLCGGFPCQDISAANPKGRGLAGARSGLWFEFARLIEECEPDAVVIENSPRLVRRGLDVIVAHLHARGFKVEGTRLRAEDVGAPHRRERLFILGYRDPQGQLCQGGGAGDEGRGRASHAGGTVADANGRTVRHEPGGSDQGDRGGAPFPWGSGQAVADATGSGRGARERGGRAGQAPVGAGTWPVEPEVGGLPPGFPRGLDGLRWPRGRGPEQHPWEPPRTVAPRTLATRAQRVKAYGNAVVPQCAYVVGMRLKQLMEET